VLLGTFDRTRVEWKDHRQFESCEVFEDLPVVLRVVDVLGAVECREHEPARFDAVGTGHGRLFLRRRQQLEDGFDDGVPRLDHAVSVDPFGGQVLDVDSGGRTAQVGEMVGDDSIVFFRHVAVEAAQARLDVADGDVAGVGSNGSGEDGVGVALHDHGIRGPLGEQLVQLLDGDPDLRTAGETTDGEEHIRLLQAHLGEEGAAQLGVVVLAGVDDEGGVAQQPDQVGELDDLGSGSEHDRNRLRREHVGAGHESLPGPTWP
jgi:hypothetical protein